MPTPHEDLALLYGLLRSPDAVVRCRVANELGNIGNPAAAEPLCRLLDDPVPRVRVSAVIALGRLKDTASASGIAAMLKDKDHHVRAAAAWALGALGARQFGLQLREALTDWEPDVGKAAKSALVALGDTAAFADLLERLPGSLDQLRLMGDRTFAAAVVPYLKHEREFVRLNAIDTLARMHAAEFVDAVIEACSDPVAMVRASAARALRSLSPARAKDPLIRLLGDPDAMVVHTAAYEIGWARWRDAIPALLKLLADPRPVVRAAGVWALGTVREPEAAVAIGRMVDDPDINVVSTAAWAVQNVGAAPGVLARLIPLLRHRDEHVRDAVCETLEVLNAQEARGDLQETLANGDETVRASAADALGWLGDSADRVALMSIANDANPDVRAAALTALGRLGAYDEGEGLLRRGVEDEHIGVRLAASIALLRWGKLDPRAERELLETVSDRGDSEKHHHELLEAIAEHHDPDTFKRYRDPMQPKAEIDLEALLRQRGLHVSGLERFGTWDTVLPCHQSSPLVYIGRLVRTWADTGLILARFSVRIVDRARALDFWRGFLPEAKRTRALDNAGVLSGVVVDAETGAPVRDAVVHVRSVGQAWGSAGSMDRPEFRQAAVTNVNGEFRVDRLREWRYQIDVQAPGYLSHLTASLMAMRPMLEAAAPKDAWALFGYWGDGLWDTTYNATIGESAEGRNVVPMVHSGSTSRVEIRLKRGRAITGVVRRADGAKIENALIAVQRQQIMRPRAGLVHGDVPWPVTIPHRGDVRSDATGRFSIHVHPEGEALLRIAAEGHNWREVKVDVGLPVIDLDVVLDNDPKLAQCQRLIERISIFVQRLEMRDNHYPASGNASLVGALKRGGFEFDPGELNERGELVDPWGRPLIYVNWAMQWPGCMGNPSAHNETSFDLYSAGSNGVDEGGAGDDLGNW